MMENDDPRNEGKDPIANVSSLLFFTQSSNLAFGTKGLWDGGQMGSRTDPSAHLKVKLSLLPRASLRSTYYIHDTCWVMVCMNGAIPRSLARV